MVYFTYFLVFKVLMVIILIWVMFAILGMNLLSNKLGYCKGSPTIYGYG